MRKVMIIRHAEKPVHGGPDRSVCIDGYHAKHELTVRGWQRAAALVAFFAPRGRQPHHPHIDVPRALFAAAATEASPSLRSRRTVEPLAAALALPIDTGHAEGEERALAQSVLAGRLPALIAWHHHAIPALARLIGAGPDVPEEWPHDRYDMVWVLEETARRWSFQQVPQLIFAHDRDEPIAPGLAPAGIAGGAGVVDAPN